ncbi:MULTISPECIES: ferredoxin--NADP reductase [Halorussus]|uniref:ferredoxin--NADP reductase n=1 Tax=Halorussus TaxID=1070314 RepID=UPI00209FFD2B|nr:FAD-dependent oxidoreductase [Halorussus vallis]USZ75115.1 FAD-dependent oxidoreductase [Halorussus vallis]
MDGMEVAVESVETVGPDTVALVLETPDGFDAAPGQFVQLAATIDGEEVTRHYTLSSPDAEGTFEVTVEVDPEGSLSPYLADLTPGDRVEVAGPFGNSYYEGEDGVVVLAGGPGVGPAVGIGERATENGGAVTIVYEDDQPVHEDRLAALSAAGANVAITTDVTSEDVVALLANATGQVFVYGFADFLDEATAALDAARLSPEEAKTENFGPAPESS